jgi:hypothetical protein
MRAPPLRKPGLAQVRVLAQERLSRLKLLSS